MDKWQRRTVYYSILLTGVMLVYAVLYYHGMRIYEGESRIESDDIRDRRTR